LGGVGSVAITNQFGMSKLKRFEVRKLAAEMIKSQETEIKRMQQWQSS
jgi:uncharacterized protein (DUF305 family)